ncbi:unnamed protein product [Linum trigynum]|uniref:Small acidic protein-like domain-containing protein n=1 Tax=Linum trigynum TaxID=586398 RepID=A0AAV2EIK6_9ROSI
MDPKVQSSPPDTEDEKATFRKSSNDVASRKYRRHLIDIKSSGDPESPRNDRASSPIFTRGEPGKVSEHRESRKDEGRKYDRDQRVKSGDADSRSSKNPHPNSRHDDYGRRDEDRRSKPSYLDRDSRGTSRSDRMREESDNGRSRDYRRYSDKYSRDRDTQRSKDKESYPVPDRKQTNSTSEDKDFHRHRNVRDNRDGERNYGRSSEYGNERTDYRGGSRGRVKESLLSRKDDDKYRAREFQKGNPNEVDDWREKKKRDGSEPDRGDDAYSRASGQNEDKSLSMTESQQSEAKRMKLFSSDKAVHPSGDGEKQSLSPKQVAAAGTGSISEATNDLNAAKVAAMKAAELVNQNLVGGSFMSTDQKKKLLWGNKKSTTTSEEKRWDTSMFGDRERQEKFNKLMGVKGDARGESQTNNNQEGLQAEKQEQLQMELEKQYTAGLRRRDGRTVGLGL